MEPRSFLAIAAEISDNKDRRRNTKKTSNGKPRALSFPILLTLVNDQENKLPQKIVDMLRLAERKKATNPIAAAKVSLATEVETSTCTARIPQHAVN